MTSSHRLRYRSCCCFTSWFTLNYSPPPDVDSLFSEFSVGGIIGPIQLQKFLRQVQGEDDVSEEKAQQIIDTYLHDASGRLAAFRHPGRGLTKESFFGYLLSPKHNPSILSEVHHDMTAPLSHYYVYTGHNSYLKGNQISSDSSVEPIIEALQRGVRVIELDIWPSTSKDKVVVRHGRTLTPPVDFEKCIKAIHENAFKNSLYPVIITLEDHLKPDLQAKVAEIVTKIFGETLYIPENAKGLKEFPSPEALKGRILISTKPPKEYSGDKKGKELKREDEEKEQEGRVPSKSARSNKVLGTQQVGEEEEEEEEGKETVESAESEDEDDASDETHMELEVAPEYKQLISICGGKTKQKSLKSALALDDGCPKRVSFSEPELEKVAKKHPSLVVQFTRKNFLRIYPKAMRLDSSNYYPLIAWLHGAQMVAFNMQGYGRYLWLVHGFFRANGGCGYVKKPEFLLSGPVGDDNDYTLDSRPIKMVLKVKVYMGTGWLETYGKTYFDRCSPPDFFTRVRIFGAPADRAKKETNQIENDWTPHWNSEFSFPLTVPEMALLYIQVRDRDPHDDEFAGQTCLPVSELRTGIRAVPLHNHKGHELQSVRLMLRFELQHAIALT